MVRFIFKYFFKIINKLRFQTNRELKSRQIHYHNIIQNYISFAIIVSDIINIVVSKRDNGLLNTHFWNILCTFIYLYIRKKIVHVVVKCRKFIKMYTFIDGTIKKYKLINSEQNIQRKLPLHTSFSYQEDRND